MYKFFSYTTITKNTGFEVRHCATCRLLSWVNYFLPLAQLILVLTTQYSGNCFAKPLIIFFPQSRAECIASARFESVLPTPCGHKPISLLLLYIQTHGLHDKDPSHRAPFLKAYPQTLTQQDRGF